MFYDVLAHQNYNNVIDYGEAKHYHDNKINDSKVNEIMTNKEINM